MDELVRLTQEGYNEFLEEIKEVKKELKAIRLSKGEIATEQGNSVRENSGFADVKLREDVLMQRLADLKDTLRNVQIIEETKTSDLIDINSIVTLEIADDDEIEITTVKLVATPIHDIGSQVSINSPLGKAIYSKKVGDEVTYTVQGIKIHVKILKVEK